MEKPTSWITLGVFCLAAVACFLILGWATLDPVSGFAIPALLIIVSLALLVLLMIFAGGALQRRGMSDVTQPFGLPSGTVRAVLTLAFIVLVGVFGSYVLSKTNGRTDIAPVWSGTMRSDEADRLVPAVQGAALGKDLVVVRSDLEKKKADDPQMVQVTMFGKAQYAAADDVAKQVLQTLTTILAAMIGFYFGARIDTTSEGADAGARKEAQEELTSKIRMYDDAVTAAEAAIIAGNAKAAADPTAKTKIDSDVASLRSAIDSAKSKIDGLRVHATDPDASTKVLEDDARNVAPETNKIISLTGTLQTDTA